MSAALRGTVFDVSRACVDDGPGLRTVVFLKGCHLGCPWCHNPEGLSGAPQIAFDATRCIQCGACLAACDRDWSLWAPGAWRVGCVACGKCADACPAEARRVVGREVAVADLVDEVLRDRDFFEGTGGGVTFSGGEPLLQVDFVLACAAELRDRGVHVAVETAGLWSRRHASRVAAAVDLVLFDLKHCDPEALRAAVGQDGAVIRENLDALLATNVDLELRLTLVPGFNAARSDLETIAAWLRDRPRVPPVRLQAFHRLATAKSQRYGGPPRYAYADVQPLPPAALVRAAAVLEAGGVDAITA